MKFKTQYTSQQIKSILEMSTKPYHFSNLLTNNILISKQKKNKIFLVKTGSMGVSRGQFPFIGKLIEKDGYTIIEGKFTFTYPGLFILITFLGYAWFSILKACVFNSNFNIFNKIIVCYVGVLWSFFGVSLFFIFNYGFLKKRQNDVLEFIERSFKAEKI